MARYKPSLPFTVAIELLTPETKTIKGARKKVYSETGDLIFCSFKTYGGTESRENNIYVIIDTATVETWYDPRIKSECRIKLLDTDAIYEIINEPENVEMRNQYCVFKVRRVKGGT